ncbi:hypothetical protein [Clostridium beijerinckii]|nr:hypothetical protein [Clostridium beijerinckii]
MKKILHSKVDVGYGLVDNKLYRIEAYPNSFKEKLLFSCNVVLKILGI